MPTTAHAHSALPSAPPGTEPSHSFQSSTNHQIAQQNGQPLARLVIEEPRLSDEALYKCDVTYVKGKCPSISLVRLQMMSLPQRAQLVTAQGAPIPPNTPLGPYNERDHLRLVCLVYGGRPAPRSVIWRRIDPAGRRVNLASSRYSTKAGKDSQSNLVEVELNHTLSSADLGSKFECHVEHEALEPQLVVEGDSSDGHSHDLAQKDALLDLHPFAASATGNGETPPAALPTLKNPLDAHAYIDLNVGVASLDLFLSKVNRRNSSELLREGDLIELECVAYNSRPPANITWLNGAEWGPPGGSSGLLEGDATTSGATESPEVVVSRQKRLLQRSQVVANADGHTFNTHSYLSIKLSRHEHRAQITCKATNGVPANQPPLAKSLELQVQHAPIVLMEPANGLQVREIINNSFISSNEDIKIEDEEKTNVITSASTNQPLDRQQTTTTTNTNEPVSIYCIYSANPNELLANSTRWFKDGQPLEVGPGSRLRESHTSTGYPMLHIGQVTRRDSGLYECQVANSVGFSERLPVSEQSRLEVLFKPSVKLRLFKRLSPLMNDDQEQEQEIDPEQELIQSGQLGFVFTCEVLEANPKKIQRFQWHRWPLSGATTNGPQTVATTTTDTNRLHLSSLPANFSGTSYACAAANSLGTSHLSNRLELKLSHTPGPSTVSPVADANLRRAILASGKPARPAPTEQETALSGGSEVLPAGKELMLECLTRQLGQPKANIWLWFKDGQPIEASSSSSVSQDGGVGEDTGNGSNQATTSAASNDLIPATNYVAADDNPITGQDLSWNNNNNKGHHHNTRLISSGRYLYISSVQLAHKGNYSCVAVNRLGSGGGRQEDGKALEHDSYRFSVALAPSFVQPLPARSYWPEVQITGQLELVCQVQCEPLCQIEWLRNNEPLGGVDLLESTNKQRHLSPAVEAQQNSNYVRHQVSQTVMEERPELNLFRGVESKLVLQFLDPTVKNSRQVGQKSRQQQQQLARDKILDRRAQLSGANYTCQSSGNAMGLPVRSTTRFIVQYPPENVLITGLSDKLNIVEGSNGPRLSCEASGEPQVEYRWFLLKNRLGSDESLASFQSKREPNVVAGSPQNGSEWAATMKQHQANDDGLLELTANAQQHQQRHQSMLDLSQLSVDRSQAGHYVCEASNRLGQTRQSVYLNVLYKPTCSALHLHSMDMIVEPPTEADKSIKIQNGLVFKAKPFKTNHQDEYRLIRETSDDFIGLRKTLVLSPLLNRYSEASLQENDNLSFQGSIFSTLLGAKNQDQARAPLLQWSSEKIGLLASLDNGKLPATSEVSGEQVQSSSSASSAWDRFNMLLLKFLNSYIRQVRQQEEMIESQAMRQQRRRSPTSNGPENGDETNELGEVSLNQESKDEVKNLLTFACMAQDADPINNLTFDWDFGSTSLPEYGDQALDLDVDNKHNNDGEESNRVPPIKPTLIYTNTNSTVHVLLVRRLDTRSSLNPFQVSLVTLDVVVESSKQDHQVGSISGSSRRHLQEASARQWYHRGSGNIQSHEMNVGRLLDGTRFGNELNEHNWQEQIGELLKCRISNQIGTSKACHVRVNIAERLKGSVSESSSSSEFAKWRMPSFASKSLVIIAILIACSLIVLLTLTLVVGPQFRLMTRNLSQSRRKGDGVGSSKKETMMNTVQSTSSQKSSVLGLLGNGESSIQGSSDDDCSAGNGNGRLTGLQSRPNQNNNQTTVPPGRRMLDLDNMSLSRSVANGYHHHHHHYLQANRGQMMQDSTGESGYDKPRDLQEQRVTYSNLGTCISSHGNNSFRLGNSQKATSAGSRLLANLRFKSLSHKLKVDKVSDVSSLTSRMDLARNLHTKTGSSSETNTTGLSGASNLDAGEQQQSMTTPMSSDSPTFFGSAAMRQSVTSGAKKRGQPLNPSYYLYDDTNALRNEVANESGQPQMKMQMQLPMVQSTPRQTLNSMAASQVATYSNMFGAYDVDDDGDALEEFIRQREPVDPTATYHGFGRPMYLLKQDLSSQFDTSTLNHGNNHQYHLNHQGGGTSASLYRSQIMNPNETQRVLAQLAPSRSSTQQQMLSCSVNSNNNSNNTAFHQHQNNRFSMPIYNQQLFARPPVGAHMDTIDTHLNRLESVIQRGYYDGDNQQEPSSIAYANTIDNLISPYGAYNPHQNHNQQQQRHQQTHMLEHIYDVNAYATPEQTPTRRLISGESTSLNKPSPSANTNATTSAADNRPRVSQLIQSFNSRAPEP